MNFIKKIFNTLFGKLFFVTVIICCLVAGFFFQDWTVKQYHKVIGMYYVYKGDKAYRHRDLQKAIDFYNQGLELYPEHYTAQFNLGNIYVVYEDYYAAADAYEKAIEYNKNFTLARMNLGIIMTDKLGDFDEAIAQYNEIINSRKKLWFIPFIFRNTRSEKINRGLAYYNMGVAYREKSLYQNGEKTHSAQYLQEAINSYKNAVKILKKNYDAFYNLALAYQLAGNYQDAGLNYCKAIELEPMNYEAHYNLAVLLKHLRMYKESLDELQKATVLVYTTNSGSAANTSTYVFDVLNEVSEALIANDEYNFLVEKVDNGPVSEQITYVNGKIVATDALDRAMLKNFSTCKTEEYFSGKVKEQE